MFEDWFDDIDNPPLPVVTFLNVIGVSWPYLNSTAVEQFASVVRQFAGALSRTHTEVTATVGEIGDAYRGVAGRTLRSGWARLTAAQVHDIVEASHVFADGLDGLAAYCDARKVVAAEQFAALTTAFIADQAAAVETGGLSEVAMPLIYGMGRAVGSSLLQDLGEHVTGAVVESAAAPFFAKIDAALSELDWSKSGSPAEPGPTLEVDLPELKRLITAMSDQAQVWSTHGAAAKQQLDALAFG